MISRTCTELIKGIGNENYYYVRTLIRGRFSALSFRTSQRIFLEKSLFCLFSLYLNTLASLCPIFHSPPPPPPPPCTCSTLLQPLLLFALISGTFHNPPLVPQSQPKLNLMNLSKHINQLHACTLGVKLHMGTGTFIMQPVSTIIDQFNSYPQFFFFTYFGGNCLIYYLFTDPLLYISTYLEQRNL